MKYSRIDYVETKLDETVKSFIEANADIKESVKDNKEAIARLESRLDESRKEFKEAMLQMEARHQANFVRLENSLDKAISRAESSRNWVVGFVMTVAMAVIGFILNYLGVIQA